MHAFHLDAVNEDFAERPRLGQAVDQFRIELEGQHGGRQPLLIPLEIIGPQRCLYSIHAAPQDPVLIKTRNAVQCLVETGLQLGKPTVPRLVLEAPDPCAPGKLEDRSRDCRIFVERVGDQPLGIGNAGLRR